MTSTGRFGAAKARRDALEALLPAEEFDSFLLHADSHARPATKAIRQTCQLTTYSLALRRGQNQADSLLLQPLVVSVAKSASAALFRSRMPWRSADTASRFQP